MGFSLKVFIDEIQSIIKNSSIFTIHERLRECIARNVKLAKDAGVL